MEFFEPEDEYKTEKGRKRNVKTKISFITGIIIFGSVLILFVQNDFIKVFGKEAIVESCVYNNTYNKLDNQTEKIRKSEKALRDHLGSISELNGYLDSRIKLTDSNETIIYLYFAKNSKDKTRIPETICGNQIIVETK